MLNGAELNLFQKLTVRTANIDKDGKPFNQGSGTIIGSGKRLYVLTAGHCVNGVDKEHLFIEYFNGNQFVKVDIIDILFSKYNKDTGEDYAVIEIKPINNGIDYCQIIKRFDLTIPKDSYFMLSYPPVVRNGRFFEVQENVNGYWHVVADVNYAQDDFKDVISGSSGAGIFVYRHNRFYYVGMAIATRDNIGRFNDIFAAKPSVFDGIIPDDTKDNDYFNTLKKWEEWNDHKNAQERRDIIKNLHVDWLEHLTRKTLVLFPSDCDKKVDYYILCYLKGMEIIGKLLVSNPSFVNELNKKDKSIFNRLVDNHKEDFDTSEGAYQDLQGIIAEVKSKVSANFPEDQDETIALGYALYRVAEKLLNCHLDYKSNT